MKRITRSCDAYVELQLLTHMERGGWHFHQMQMDTSVLQCSKIYTRHELLSHAYRGTNNNPDVNFWDDLIDNSTLGVLSNHYGRSTVKVCGYFQFYF